jgi:hypothetical protein
MLIYFTFCLKIYFSPLFCYTSLSSDATAAMHAQIQILIMSIYFTVKSIFPFCFFFHVVIIGRCCCCCCYYCVAYMTVFFPVIFLTRAATILDRFTTRTLFEIDIVHIIFGDEAIGARISFFVRFASTRAIRSLQTINTCPATALTTAACKERPTFAVGTEI